MVQDTSSLVKSFSCTCLHKIEIINPFTREKIFVPCGKCPACLYSKSVRHELRCQLQSVLSKYCYFVTLSYDVHCCPTYILKSIRTASGRLRVIGRDSGHRDGNSRCSGLSRHHCDDFTFGCTPEYYRRYTRQADQGIRRRFYDRRFANTYGYLNHEDLSLFMKRFRKILYSKSQCYEQIHSYIVGEYGIDHFRPHFHLLLFFSSDKIAENIGYAVNRSWKYGRVVWSQNRKDAISYVAGYLNSFTYLPFHLREIRQFRPFSRFSNGFACSAFLPELKKAAQGDFSTLLTGLEFTSNGSRFKIFPWSSVLRTVIYKPTAVRGASVSDVLTLIYSISKVSRRPFVRRNETIFSFTRRLAEYISIASLSKTRDVFNHDIELKYILHFIGITERNRQLLHFHDNLDALHGSLYRLFYDTNEFLKGQNQSIFLKFDENFLISRIINSLNFYHEYNVQNLKNYSQSMHGYPDGIRDYFFRATKEKQRQFRETGLGRLILQHQSNLVYNRIKHRELNEKNKFFISS
ncbi:hypothetical protein EZV61_19180 [Corallincola luteus]|uniref:Replication-associated protein ORF2/G2P domain-containing protein n=1 Tax=Corallincola luteus TaxID=1775177 RepID=A0ABY2AFW2_9GAMM|nr:hypothetical protein [Corallincola luteus]TCI01120.1 hypothetical protein EZV61_19180 [Corallincola luteus]